VPDSPEVDSPSAPVRRALLASAVFLAAVSGTAGAQCTIPAAPANPSPAAGATLSSGNVQFAWSAAAGTPPISYQVLLDGPSVVCTTISTSCSLAGVVGSHTWRVTATNACGAATGGPWTFSVGGGQGCVAPGAPANPSPAAGAVVTSASTLVAWSAVGGTAPILYDVYVDTPASPQCSTTATSCQINYLTTGNHTWWVRTSNCAGDGGTGGPWSLVVNLPCVAPGTPPLVSPASGATGVGGAPTLKWQAPSTGSGPFTYDVVVDGTPVAACTGTAALTCSLSGLPITVTPHSWSVTARNACGNATSATRTFVTCANTAPPVPAFTWLEQAPLLVKGVQQAQPYAGQPVHFVDSTSGNPTAWQWSFGDGLVRTEQNQTFSWPVPGSYQVALAAANCFGAAAPVTATVVVYADVRPVTADFAWSPPLPVVGAPLTFTAASGSDNGDPTEFAWTFPGGEQASGRTVGHAFFCSGDARVRLVARRGAMVSAPTSKVVTVAGTPTCCLPPNRADTPVPESDATVPGGAVTLRWARPSEGTDPLLYDVFLDGVILPECTGTAVALCNTTVPDGAITHLWKVIARNGCGDTTTYPDTPTEWRFKACSAPSAPEAMAFTWQPAGIRDFGGVEQQQPYVGQAVTFSYDSATPATSLVWTDYQQSPAVVYRGVSRPVVTYAAPGEYAMGLEAGNCAGSTAATGSVTVYPDVRPVTARVTITPEHPAALEVVSFTLDAGESAGEPNEFTIDFGDGSAATTTSETTVQHLYRCGKSARVTVTARRVKVGSTVASAPASVALDVAGDRCSPDRLLVVDLPRRVEHPGQAPEGGGAVLFNADTEPMLLEMTVRDGDSGQLRRGLSVPLLPPQGTVTLEDVVAWLGLDFHKATVWLRNAEAGASALPVVSAWRYQEQAGGQRCFQYLPVLPLLPPSSRGTTQWLAGLVHDSLNAARGHYGFVTRLTLVDPAIADYPRTPWGDKKVILTLLDGVSGAVLRTDSINLDSYGGYRCDYLNSIFHLSEGQDLNTVSVKLDVPAGVSLAATATIIDNASGSSIVIGATPTP
jgi:PKD repeat protein